MRIPDHGAGADIGRLVSTLNTMLARLEDAFAHVRISRERLQQFVADAGHELRTPLTTVLGLLRLHRAGALTSPTEQEQALTAMHAQSRRMQLLVEDLLLLAHFDAERPLEREPVDLVTLAVDGLAAARALEPDRPLRLELPAAPGEPLPSSESGKQEDLALTVLGDPDRLAQVVSNLVMNALRHTPPATPVTIRLSTDPPTHRVLLAVVDTGPGIPATEADRIFERFHRLDSARSRHSDGGSGLGLAIVAAIMEAHSGTVRCLPTPGGGATFEVGLPMPPSRASPAR